MKSFHPSEYNGALSTWGYLVTAWSCTSSDILLVALLRSIGSLRWSLESVVSWAVSKREIALSAWSLVNLDWSLLLLFFFISCEGALRNLCQKFRKILTLKLNLRAYWWPVAIVIDRPRLQRGSERPTCCLELVGTDFSYRQLQMGFERVAFFVVTSWIS